MTKKKSIWAFVLALCLIVPAMFMLTACGHTHTFSKEWTKNETHHWYAATCEHADEKGSYGEHVYDNDTDRDCNTCGYVRAIANEISFNSIETRTYNKTAQPLKSSEYTVAHDAGEVKIEYKLKGAEDNTYSTTAPVNAGEYTVKVTVQGNESYLETSKTTDFKIDKYTLTEINGNHTKEYDGNVNIVKRFTIFAGDNISVQILMSSKNVDATIYQMVINGPAKDNYQLPTDLSGVTAQITAKKLNFDTSNMTKVYDGTANYRYDFTTADGLVAGDECYVSFVALQRSLPSGEECINVGEYSNVVTNDNVTASNSNYVIDITYSNYGDLDEGINTKLTITKRKLNNFDLKVTSTDVPEGSTGNKIISFTISSKVASRDNGKVIVKVTFKAELILNETTLDLIANNSYDTESEAKIEFKTDGDTAYQNYEFDTTNLGTISFQN